MTEVEFCFRLIQMCCEIVIVVGLYSIYDVLYDLKLEVVVRRVKEEDQHDQTSKPECLNSHDRLVAHLAKYGNHTLQCNTHNGGACTCMWDAIKPRGVL